MIALLSWPTYGARLRGRGRGGCIQSLSDPSRALPAVEPVAPPGVGPGVGPGTLWPAVRLDEGQRGVVRDDLARIATIRSFQIEAMSVGADHVHLLLSFDEGRDVPHLVQLIKGATARALSVAEGEADSGMRTDDKPSHRKWWGRQYLFQIIDSDPAVDRVRALLDDPLYLAGESPRPTFRE